MTRTAIQREDFYIPASEDFIAAFGGELEFDEQTHTECYLFADDANRVSRMYIGIADRTFGLSIIFEGDEIVRVYDENLSEIRLDEERQVIIIKLGTFNCDQKVELAVWPRIAVSFSRLR